LEGFFGRQVTRWLERRNWVLQKKSKVKRSQIVRETPQKFHIILVHIQLGLSLKTRLRMRQS
jgi:hypothetical protein